jgi:hypothetical protein
MRGDILTETRTKVVREKNKAEVLAYWEIGREIVEFEQKGEMRAEYGEELLKKHLSYMTARFGKGFSRSNLQNIRLFYLAYPKCQTLSGKFELMLSPHSNSYQLFKVAHFQGPI